MAIQIPNPGTGNGATGDNEYVLWSKVKDNFDNSAHAASRLVGTENGNVAAYHGDSGLSGLGYGGVTSNNILYDNVDKPSGLYRTIDGQSPYAAIPGQWASIDRKWFGPDNFVDFAWTRNHAVLQRMAMRAVSVPSGDGLDKWTEFYTTSNTTKDTATGFLKASSPVLHVYNDSIAKIHEANQLDITVDKKGVGHYEIHGTTGLRKDDGWFMSPPRDVHGNILCMVDLEETDGVIILRTYKKLFDFETVSIVHDYDNPMDIPEGVCVEFRFNDLPVEIEGDTQTED